MSKKTKSNEELGEEPAAAPDAVQEVEGERLDAPQDIETLQRERDEYLRNWQRAQADYKNLKRRQLGDIDAAVRRSQQSVLESVLLVLDNLDMAIAMPCTTDEGKNLLVGIEMTRKQILDVLEREEVERIDSEGAFDPARHQAVATVEVEDEAQAGQILATVRPGWTYRGQVLRYAQVHVGALPEPDAPPTPAAAGEQAEPSEDDATDQV
jgi:molecular chaperone GrpE